MTIKNINDTKLIRLVDIGYTQADIAKEFGVSRQAVCKRLRELRGKTTKVMVTKNLKQVVKRKMDALEQLHKINEEANRLLDELETQPELKLKIMAEIRGQLKLQLDIFQALFSLQAAEEFQQTILEVIGEVDPDVRAKIIYRLNKMRSVREAVRFA